MKQIFKDKNNQSFFEENGYIKLQILNQEQIDILTDLYNKTLNMQTRDGFSTTLDSPASIKKQIAEVFHQIFASKIQDLFIDFKVLSYNFLTKKTENSIVPLHQDWSFLDIERDVYSFNIWCPLVDTNSDNGNFKIVPKSHLLSYKGRMVNEMNAPYTAFKDYLNQHTIELPTKQGEAIIYTNSLLHASTPNKTNTIRLTVGTLVVPSNESLILRYLSADQKEVECYKLPDDYLLLHNPLEAKPSEQFLYKKTPYTLPENQLDELKRILDSRKQNFISYIYRIFLNRIKR